MISSKATTASFQVGARLVSILGEQLISDRVVGLLELVKNGHDADASQLDIEAHRLKHDDATLTVTDDGFGMSLTDVETRFLVPATNSKSKLKAQNYRTPMGRMQLGEKGIGRFATQALAHELELITRKKGEPEVVVRIDWDRFTTEAALDSIKLELVEREPEIFRDDWTGTKLILRRLRESWAHGDLDRLQRGLRRLKSPFPKFGLTSFDIKFICADYPKFQDLEPVDLEDCSHYKFKARIDDDEGPRILYEYSCQHPSENLNAYRLHQQVPEELEIRPDKPWRDADDEEDCSGPAQDTLRCGPFTLTLFVFDREGKYFKSSKSALRHGAEFNGKDLDAMCGISVFKEDLRVLPYGEPGNDWLKLDQARINNPSGRIGNKQVVGFVELSQSLNSELREKADREGFQENKALRDLRRAILAAIDLFYTNWLNDRPKSGHSPGRVQSLKNDPRVTFLGGRKTIPSKSPPKSQTHPDIDPEPVKYKASPSSETATTLAGDEGPSTFSINTATVSSVNPQIGRAALAALPQKDALQGMMRFAMDAGRQVRQLLKTGSAGMAAINDWAEALLMVGSISGQSATVNVKELVGRLTDTTTSEWKRRHIKVEVIGETFNSLLVPGVLLLALHACLTAAAADLEGRPTKDRSLVLSLQPFDSSLRISWMSNDHSPQGPTCASPYVLEAQQLIGSCGGQVTFESEDMCIVFQLPPAD